MDIPGWHEPEAECGNSDCCSSKYSFKACAGCAIVSYCGKECQVADWKRHKDLCLSCRPYKDVSKRLLSIPMKYAVQEYSAIVLPKIDEEYGRKFQGPMANTHKLWIHGGLMTTQEMLRDNLRNMQGSRAAMMDLVKRWQEVSENLQSFILTAQLGDIFLKKRYLPYNPGAPQQFRNTPLAEPGVLKNGTTFIDIGFVDFGMTLDSIDSLRLEGDPLVVMGYEAEAQCVAKTMIMLQMMKDEETTPRSLVEVWLSSLWSKNTFRAFKNAARVRLQDTGSMKWEVRRIIEFWSKSPTVRKEQILALEMKAVLHNPDTTFAVQCCSLVSENDRVAYLRYHFTKAWTKTRQRQSEVW